MESKHLIIGAGEIGQSMWEVLNGAGVDVLIRDKESEIVGQFNYLHFAIGCTNQDEFIKIVKEYEEMYNPHTIVIHSTVPLGTIRALGEKAVHAPVRGRHPHLEEGIRTFVMYVGGNDLNRVESVYRIFQKARIPLYLLDPKAYAPETTEALKLWCTTYLAWLILFEKELHRFCEEQGLSFDIIYKHLNRSYNEGYEKLGESQFIRPVLDHVPGPIGGHCQIPNCVLLGDVSYIPQLILEKNETFKEELNG